jgi:callose synthase
MALQELSFVTLGQRVLARPLHIRQHYGHPDLFDKIFVMTEGGMSKASRGINLSEDVFAGFNATIRGHTVGFKEYVQVGKGRDVGLQQTYKFEAKLSQGNAEQSLSRDVDRICDRLDFFRLLSFYYGGIGHYMANTLVMFTLVVIVYSLLALAIYGEEGVDGRDLKPEGVFQLVLSGMGLLQTLPLLVTLVVEKGIFSASMEIAFMILSGGPLYFIFHIQTKCYYFQQTLLAGGAMYRPTGRGFVIRHSPFAENFRFFASSHIYLGFELLVALILFGLYTTSNQYAGLTWSLWLTVAAFLLGPFWFNPLSFEWNKVSEDYSNWITWMLETGGTAEQSWDVWWREENSFFKDLSISWKVYLFVQKCCLWVFISVGLCGLKFLDDAAEQERVLLVVMIFVAFFFGNWTIAKLERHLTYAVRRFISMLLSTVVLLATCYLFATHMQYVRYTIAIYYLLSAGCFCMMISGFNVSFVYKFHDYVVCYFLFFLIGVLALFRIGTLQTWLLYHNALSSGVAIEDVLKYARKTKERASTEEDSISELKAQVANQERLIRQLISGENTKGYGSVATSIPIEDSKAQQKFPPLTLKSPAVVSASPKPNTEVKVTLHPEQSDAEQTSPLQDLKPDGAVTPIAGEYVKSPDKFVPHATQSDSKLVEEAKPNADLHSSNSW